MGNQYTLGRDGAIYVPATLITIGDDGLASVGANLDAILAASTAVTAFNAELDSQVTGLTLLSNVGDVNRSGSTQEIDFTTRDSGGFDATAPVSKTVEWSGTSNVRDAMGVLSILEDAYEAQTEVFAMFLSRLRTVAGARGHFGNWTVTNFADSQPIKGVQTVSWTLKGSVIRRVELTADP